VPTFFEQQDRARRNTRTLVALMGAAVVGMALSIYALLIVVAQWMSWHTRGRYARPVATGPDLFQPSYLLACLAVTAAIVAVASLSRLRMLSAGGAHVAEMLGGRLVSGQPRDGLEKRLLDVVEEMAIASGMPVPQVYVLEGERSINAFAAGFSADDAVIAVTRGSLERLSRDELQGVVAHEMSHVLNGDMRLNMRLMGVVFGIVCIALLGRFLMQMSGSTRTGWRRSDSDRSSAGAFFVFGLGVFLIGLVGELFGKLIKAAVSRQREFLADASAVQFTRNPGGIAGALKKIGGVDEGSSILAPHAEEASHFFFGDIHTAIYQRLWDFDFLATHPPLVERIQRVDPSFRGEFPAVPPGVAEEPPALPIAGLAGRSTTRATATPTATATATATSTSTSTSTSTPTPTPTPDRPRPAPTTVVAQVGTLAPADRGRDAIAAIGSPLREVVENPFSACASVYALLLSDDPAVRDAQVRAIESLSGAALRAQTMHVADAVRALPRRSRLPLVHLAAPALRRLSSSQRAAFTATVQALIEADHALSLFEAVVAQTLRARLADEASAQRRSRVRHRSFEEVQQELALLLSLIAHAGARTPDAAPKAFAAGAARLPGVRVALLPRDPRLLAGLDLALDELAGLAPRLRAQVVDACAHVALADEQLTDDEEMLLRAVCDALGSPLPALGG
jgi:Zn-dependent protease with chaperone function/uncharacterized tellurite resistance protein B-like protein